MITYSINFGMGTPVITALMLLGTMSLLIWDYKKWIILFQKDHHIKLDLTTQTIDTFMNNPVWTIAGIIFVLLTPIPSMLAGKYLIPWAITMLLVGVISLLVVLRVESKKRMQTA